jgi:hypothetical protein
MRRSLSARILAAVWGVWLVVALTEPAALHACPMHDAAHGTMGHALESHGAASHQHDGADDRPAHSSSRSHHSVCTCIGSCCAAVADVLRAPAALTVVETIRTPTVVDRTPLIAFRPSVPEHVHPPSQGPPISLA